MGMAGLPGSTGVAAGGNRDAGTIEDERRRLEAHILTRDPALAID